MEPLSEDQKKALVQGLGFGWITLAGHLGFTKADIDGFTNDGAGQAMQIRLMLESWCTQKRGEADAVDSLLIPALHDMERKDLVGDIEMKTRATSTGITYVCNINKPVRYFQARHGVEEQISSSLRNYKISLLCGIHGSGKSQMALDYWSKHRDKGIKSVNWLISAGSPETLRQGLLKLNSRLRLPKQGPDADIKGLFTAILRELHLHIQMANHFIIFDDASKKCCLVIDESVRDADAENVSVLVTSVFRNLPCAVHLTGFTEDEVLEFFYKDEYCKKACIKQADVLSFAQKTCRLPLAMASARAYMSRSKISIKDYERRLKSENEKVRRAVLENQHLQEYDRSLLGALLLNVDMVRTQFLSIEQEQLFFAFQMTAFLSSEEVPLFLLMEGVDAEDEEERVIVADMFVEQLESMSVATITWFKADMIGGDTRLVSVHEAVRQAMLISLTKEEKLTKFKDVLLRIVGLTCDKDNRLLKYFVPKLFLLSHMDTVANHCKSFYNLNGFDREMQLLEIHILDALGYHYSHDLYSIRSTLYFEEAIKNICKFTDIDFASIFIQDSQTLFEKLTSQQTVEKVSIEYLNKFRVNRVYRKDYFEAWQNFLCKGTESEEVPNTNLNEGCLKPEAINKLECQGIFIKSETFRMVYLVEILISILYSFALSFFSCSKESIHLKEKHFKYGCLAHELGQKITSAFGIDALHSMLTQRSLLLFFKMDRMDIRGIQKPDDEYEADLNEALKQYEMLFRDEKTYYQLGVVKSLPAVNIYHYLYCYKSIFRCFKNMLDISEEPSIKANVFKKGHDSLKVMLETLRDSERQDHHGESQYYIEAAAFLMLSDKEEHVSEAEKFLHRAVSLQKKNLPDQLLQRATHFKRWLSALENLVKIFSQKTTKLESERLVLIEEIQMYLKVEVDENCRINAESILKLLQTTTD